MNSANPASETSRIHGGCLCGLVRFSASTPAKWCAHCHCSMCRRQHGAGFVTWVGFHSDQVSLEDNDKALRWHESSPGSRRGFCGICGSSLFFESDKWAGETHVALGCIDEPHSFKPQANAFYNTRVAWVPIDEKLKSFP